MSFIESILVALLLTLTIIYAYFKYSFRYWKSKGVPCDEPLFPYGNVYGLGKTVHMYEILKKSYDKFKPTGAKLCGVYSLSYPAAILLDLELIKNVLIKDFPMFNDRGVYYNEVDEPLSAHLVALKGDKWKKLRAKLTPSFTSGKMKFMFPTMVDVGERFRDCLSEMVKQKNELDMKDLCARFTIDVIGSCAFGIECNSLKDPNTEFKYYGMKAVDGVPLLMLTITFVCEKFAKTLPFKTMPSGVSDFFMKMVRDTVDYRETNNISRNDFMDIMIKLKNQNQNADDEFTLNELAAQAFVFFTAGFDTAAAALAFCLYEMALNPELQSKARKVIQNAHNNYDGQYTYEMMMDLPFIDQIIDETLRKYPPFVFTIRKAQRDYHVPETNIVIEKGTRVFIPIHAIHHDPEYYPNPDKFDPDRFTSDQKTNRNSMEWLPFGDGPRNCIGMRIGMMQIRIGLVTLLNNFEFSVGSKTVIPIPISKVSFTSTPDENLFLEVKQLITN